MNRGTGHDRPVISGRELVGTRNNFKYLVCEWNICDCTTSISSYIIMIKKHAGVHPVPYALLQNNLSVTYGNE